MEAIASSVGTAATALATHVDVEGAVDGTIKHDTRKDDTVAPPKATKVKVEGQQQQDRSALPARRKEERRGSSKKIENEREERRQGGDDVAKDRKAKTKSENGTATPMGTSEQQQQTGTSEGAELEPSGGGDTLSVASVISSAGDTGLTPASLAPPDTSPTKKKKKKGSSLRLRRKSAQNLVVPVTDTTEAELQEFTKIEPTEKLRCLCGMLMPSMVSTDLDKLSTAVLQLEPEHLLFARLHFKGGGRRLSVEELEEDKMSMPKFLFSDVEAFSFEVKIKEYGSSNWQMMPSPRGKEGDSFRLAAMEPDKRTSWLAHLQLRNTTKNDSSKRDSSSKTPTRVSRCFGAPKFDFMWLQRKENTWNRYFCVSSGDYLEWYTLGPVKSIPLDSIVTVEKGKKTETLRMGRSDSRIKRNWIRNYDSWVHVLWKNEYGFDCTNRFYFQSEEEASVWLESLSRFVNRTKAQLSQSDSIAPSPERLFQSATARVRIEENTKDEEASIDSINAFTPVSASFSTLPELKHSPPISPRTITTSTPERSVTIASPAMSASSPASPSPTRKRSRRSNSVGTEEGRKWSELVPRMLRRDPSDKGDIASSEPTLRRQESQDPPTESNTGDDVNGSGPRPFLDIRLPSPSFTLPSRLQTVMENRKSNRYRKFSLEDVDAYSTYDKGDSRMRFFTQAAYVKDPTVNRSLQLRNLIRGYVERANNEIGKTPFGNYTPLRVREDQQPQTSPRRHCVSQQIQQSAEPVDATQREAKVSESAPKPSDEKRPYFILCLDGGGLKSVLEATILERLVDEFPDLLERVSLFAGVSGGSMLCSCLAAGRSAMFIRTLMEGIMPHLVEGERSMNTVAGFGMKKAKYTHAAMSICGEEILNRVKMSELPKKLLVTSFLLDNVDSMNETDDRTWQARAYHNLDMLADDNDEEEFQRQVLDTQVWEFVMGSSSAPSFFPSYKKHIDGGVVANNPSLTAAVLVTGLKAKDRQPLENLRILSLGTGTLRKYIDGDQHDWGLIKWGPKLTEVLFGASNSNVDLLTTMMLGKYYHRLDPHMEEKLPMDDPSIAAKLVELGRTINLEDTIEWIRVYVYGGQPRELDTSKRVKMRHPPSIRQSMSDSEVSDQESNSDESDAEADGDDLDLKGERKRLRSVKRMWAKKRAKSADLKSQRKAHTCDPSMMHRADSNIEVVPHRHHHYRHQASTDEEEESSPNLLDASSMIKSEKETLRLFSDARRRAKKINMKPISDKLRRKSSKGNTSSPNGHKEGKRIPTSSSATFSSSSSTSLWMRRRTTFTDDEADGEIEEVETTVQEETIEETNEETVRQPGEEEGGGGLEKATSILKSIFGLQ